MPVSTFVAYYCNEDWGSGRATHFNETIKAVNKTQAEEIAGKMSLEMGPDTMLMSMSSRSGRVERMSRLQNKYDQWLRRTDRPAQYRHRYSKRRRKFG